MINVSFICNHCGCTEGVLVAEHGIVEIECKDCEEWETLKDSINIPFA